MNPNLTAGIAIGSFLLTAFAAFRAYQKEKEDNSSTLLREETFARESLAKAMNTEMSRCYKRCADLEGKVSLFESKIAMLEEKINRLEQENRRLRRATD